MGETKYADLDLNAIISGFVIKAVSNYLKKELNNV